LPSVDSFLAEKIEIGVAIATNIDGFGDLVRRVGLPQ
jgi:hypothetical protein